MNKLVISDVVEEDLPEVIALARRVSERYVFPTLSEAGQEAIVNSQAKDTVNIINNDIYKARKVKSGNRIVAYVAWRNGGYVAQLFVDSEYQGQNIGTMLLDEVVKHTKESKLLVRSSINSVGFYRKYGFISTGEEQEINKIEFVPMEYIIRD